jgi:Na+/phosphate symporter
MKGGAHIGKIIRSLNSESNNVKAHIDKIIRDLNPKHNKVKDYIKAIGEQFVSYDKALANTLMNKLSMIKHHKSRSVSGHIMKMKDVIAQLN